MPLFALQNSIFCQFLIKINSFVILSNNVFTKNNTRDVFMIIHMQKLSRIVLLMLVMHVPVYAMLLTENQVRISSGVLSLGTGLLCKDCNPAVAASVAGTTAILSYALLSKYTPQANVHNAKSILDNAANNKLAESFGTIEIEIEDEVAKDATKPSKLYDELYTQKFIERITKFYPHIPGTAPYPLVTAINNLIPVEASIEKAGSLLHDAAPYIDPIKNKKLWKDYSLEADRAQRFENNAKNAHLKITLMPQYKKDEQDLRQSNLQSDAVKAEQERNKIEKERNEIEQQKVNALQQQAWSIRSYVRLEYAKWLYKHKTMCLSIFVLGYWCLSR